MKRKLCYAMLLLLSICLFCACRRTPLPLPLMQVKKITAYEPGTGQVRYVREYSYNIAGKTATLVQTDFNVQPRAFQFYYSVANKRLDSVQVKSIATSPVWYSYDTVGRLVSFFGPDFLPFFGVMVRYNIPYHPAGGGEVAQLIARADGVKHIRQTSYFINNMDDAFKIIRGNYYMTTDENIYQFTYTDIDNPEHAVFRTSLIADYPTIGTALVQEPELISAHLPATSTWQHNTGPFEPAVTYAYDRDHYGRVVRAYIVKDGSRLLIKEYVY